MQKRSTSVAWGLAALGALLLLLNQISAGGLPIVWIIGGSCLTAGLVGFVVDQRAP